MPSWPEHRASQESPALLDHSMTAKSARGLPPTASGHGGGPVEGEDEEDGRFDVAITGGTGRFEDADGTMTVIDVSERVEFWRFDFID